MWGHLLRIGSICAVSCGIAGAQSGWEATPRFPLSGKTAGGEGMAITGASQPRLPFSVTGERGALLGQQDGQWEAWALPVKVVSHVSIEAELAGYPIPIAVNDLASSIEVRPERTTITYSHAAFTIRQHMFAPRGAPVDAPGMVVFYEIHSARALSLTIRFRPEMLRMWPAANFGAPSAEWVTKGASGYYILHTDNNAFSGAIGIPGATPGILPPYQERPRTWPVELKLRFDPARQTGVYFPVLMAAGSDTGALGRELEKWSAGWPALYAQTQSYYEKFFDTRVTVRTPEPRFDLAMKWAEVAIDQCQARHGDETGLVAGYYSSADSARPGFGWFFGRDTLFTLYAVNSYGDWDLSKRALDFLLKRQRGDGKIMHEYSQTADLVDWKSTPYFYAAADATPLLIMAMADYFRHSGDTGYIRANWEAIQRAWKFMRAHDSDGDGIYENTEGTGWVESWPPGMPHQEVYLAALDRQASTAMAELAGAMGHDELAGAAHKQAEQIAAAIEAEYYDKGRDIYAFSRNADGSLDKTSTIFPAIAWWDGTGGLEHGAGSLRRWASPEFATDWGLRDVSPETAFYDPISYHQGSVWPLYAGWESLAQYRGGNPMAGYASLMHNLGQTFTQDAGYVTELLSGEFFEPLGRSTPHQLWSSAMVLTPVLRGLFGVTADAAKNTVHVAPQLPASWNEAEILNMRLGSSRFDLRFARVGGEMEVTVRPREGAAPCLAADTVKPEPCGTTPLKVAMPAVEVEQPTVLPLPGSETAQLKIVSRVLGERRIAIEMMGPAGETAELRYRANRPGVRIENAAAAGDKLRVTFPRGSGYQRQTVVFRW